MLAEASTEPRSSRMDNSIGPLLLTLSISSGYQLLLSR